MSLFDNNIVNDLPKTEHIRFWFIEKIQSTLKFYRSFNESTCAMIYNNLIRSWTGKYKKALRKMGVWNTYTWVNLIGPNLLSITVCYIAHDDGLPEGIQYNYIEWRSDKPDESNTWASSSSSATPRSFFKDSEILEISNIINQNEYI